MLDSLTIDSTAAIIMTFLRSIGLTVHTAAIAKPTFLPGMCLEAGVLIVDWTQLKFPGDLLHEAGHLAVVPPERRCTLSDNVGSDAAEEMMAIAWSYAAIKHLQLPPEVVFHAEGYRGGGDSLIDNFAQGRYLALPMLQWVGMTFDQQRAQEAGVLPYPYMHHWLRPA